MKRVVSVLFSLAGCVFLAAAAASDDLAKGFVSPPASARPWVYWFWMDGNVSREGITADLEAMQRAGIGGVAMMEVDVGIPKGPIKFMSPEWRQMFIHAVRETERLGLQMTVNAGPGWTGSGGPWVKPEQSMQHIVASAVDVTGPKRFDEILPRPQRRPAFFGDGGLPPELEKAKNEFYRDVVVLAFPTPSGSDRIADIDEKALYVRAPYSSQPGVKSSFPASAEYPTISTNAVVESSRILDLTSGLASDGRLQWNVPEGKWTILRFGRTSTGANTRPAPAPGLGLESDKFDAAALDAHFEQFFGTLLRELGPRKTNACGWTMLHIDSWEMGAQNWSVGFRDQFRKRRGYDLLRYLPTISGRVVDNREMSERFLWDLRQTAQELVIENHAERLKKLGRKHGFGLSIEPYDMNPCSDLSLGTVADVPMCEFWRDTFRTWFSCREAVSLAHIYGRPVVAAEAFTSGHEERWYAHPGSIKALGDWAFSAGINRFAIHRYAHQPWLDRWPGMTMGPYGVHWDRTQTWWEMASAYHEYLARCQFMLQRGLSVADVLYLSPEGAPNVFRPPTSATRGDPPDWQGYAFDACPSEALVSHVKVKGGKVVLPHGMTYRVLVLPESETMTPQLLSKVRDVVKKGATVIGPPPRKSPSLQDYPKCDNTVLAIAKQVWGEFSQPAPAKEITERRYGKGLVGWPKRDEGLSFGEAPPTLEGAKWIWHKEGNPAKEASVGNRYFRRAFVVKSGQQIKSVRLVMTADNSFEAWVNGNSCGVGANFHNVTISDITEFVKPGTNLIAVLAENGGPGPNPAGLIGKIEVRFGNGETLEVVTDSQWDSAEKAVAHWNTSLSSHGMGMGYCMELGPAGMGPWGEVKGPLVEPERYCDFEVVTNVLRRMKVLPDFESDIPLRFAHRRDGNTDIYFVANPENREVVAQAMFRVTEKQPEFWCPQTGRVVKAVEWRDEGGRMRVPMKLEPYGSVFVVFREKADSKINEPRGRNWIDYTSIQKVDGSWEVRFQPGRGAPEKVAMPQLADWSQHADESIRFFSGTATYATSFDLSPSLAVAQGVYLNLGQVHEMARVKLNGKDLGVLWKFPFRVELKQALKPGINHLEIIVANLWPNRLIGDKSLPAEKRVAWTTWNPFRADTPLLESGLLGPVTLEQAGNSTP